MNPSHTAKQFVFFINVDQLARYAAKPLRKLDVEIIIYQGNNWQDCYSDELVQMELIDDKRKEVFQSFSFH